MPKWYRPVPLLSLAALLAASLTLLTHAAPTPPASPRQNFTPLSLPPQLPIATGYTAVDAFPTSPTTGLTFVQPLSIVAPPGETDRLFILSKTGTIEIVTDLDGKNGGPKKSLFLDLNPYLAQKGWTLGQKVEWGLLGLAFHPDFKHNGYFYITYDPTLLENGKRIAFDRVSRFSISKSNPNQADMTSELPLISQLDLAPNHNGGCIKFGADGYLYTSIGDEGNANDSFNNASFIDKDFFASIFRIDVDCKPQNLEPNPHSQNSSTFPSAVNILNGKAAYKIPADNPLVGISSYFGKPVDPAKVRTEIYANGLRNAWRFAFDDPTGRLFVADVGQDLYEEVDIVIKGGNYGWSYREAFHNGPRIAAKPEQALLLDPIYEYGHPKVQHDQFNGNSISGGFIYRGTKFAELTGDYIFGDYVSKRVWALHNKDGKWTPTLLASDVGTPVEFTPDPRNGDILFADIGPLNNQPNGKIKRLVRTGLQGAAPPPLLSQTGAFKNLQTLEPSPALVPYTPNVSFWSDYALKQRWFTIPNSADTIAFNPTANWTFPTGMVWIKNFDIETTRGDKSTIRRLETRFLVKTPTNVYGITYKWRPDNSDADLVPESGEDETFTVNDHGITKQQTWHYPAQSECLSCHSAVAGGALGFNTWQLNGNANGPENQLQSLARAGYFAANTPLPDPKTLGAYANADDSSASLEWRVRSYLASNCVQCHQPGGVVQGLWDARPTTPTPNAGLLNGELVANRGDSLAKVLLPNNPAHSMLLQRLQANNTPRMPPLATNEPDLANQKLMLDYIQSLPANP